MSRTCYHFKDLIPLVDTKTTQRLEGTSMLLRDIYPELLQYDKFLYKYEEDITAYVKRHCYSKALMYSVFDIEAMTATAVDLFKNAMFIVEYAGDSL